MLISLSEKEVEQINQKINKWWDKLDNNIKNKIYYCFRDVVEEIICQHNLVPTKHYSKKILSCTECTFSIENPTKEDLKKLK